MTDEFDSTGILVGWYGTIRNAQGKMVQVFIPRRDEDIDADRTMIETFFAKRK